MLSRPLLPADLVKTVLADDMMVGFPASEVFSENYHRHRLKMRDFQAPESPNCFLEDSAIGFTPEMKRTRVHSTAYDGDVLALYEILGLGATADLEDSSGVTPLCLAVAQLAGFSIPGVPCVRSDGVPLSAVDLKRETSRLKYVIRILVEQHVVLDRSMLGEPLIDLLCWARVWETIALFLEHGTSPPKNTTALFPNSGDRSKFASLLKTHSRKRPRPPRKCPCWSGKSVEECHRAKALPYPLAYMCICGSGKTYKKCCFSRSSPVVEKWDPNLKRIMHEYDRGVPADLNTLMKRLSQARRESSAILGETLSEPVKPSWSANVQRLLRECVLDPAFAHALRQAGFFPQPQARKASRVLSEKQQRLWNSLVDDYIDTNAGDKRSRHIIERAAKIGTWHGALIRTCEGPGCTKTEGKDVESLKTCSRCKMSVYCSSDCQTRAWKTHKMKCTKTGQHEQTLPSQDEVKRYQEKMLAAGNLLLAQGPSIEMLRALKR
ncbi:hypothetical protein C8R43DRAFT_470548 [Mycena crocata]|nr:hypothetical protein C8R43DRAFT_470548 [Mycena crocata]